MNPWIIISVMLALFGSYEAGQFVGHKNGVNAQKVADQKTIDAANIRTQGIIDGYTTQIAQQERDASSLIQNKQTEIIQALADRDKFKSKLEKEHADHQDTTNRLHDAYAAYSLRFRADQGGAVGGEGCAGAGGTEGNAPGDAEAPVIQLPAALTRSLRQLAYDADQLNDDYQLCYDYANR